MEKEKREQERHKSKGKAVQSKKPFPISPEHIPLHKALLLAGLSLVITLFLAPSFSTSNPNYQLGDVADQNIKAKRDFLVEVEEATFQKREEAALQAPLVYDLNVTVGHEVQTQVIKAFETMRASLAAHADRVAARMTTPDRVFDRVAASEDPVFSIVPNPKQQMLEDKKTFEALLGFQISDEIFLSLLENGFDKDIQHRLMQLLRSSFEQGIVSNKLLLREAQGKNLVVRKLPSQEEYTIPPPHHYLDLEDARKYAKMQALEQSSDTREILALTFLASKLLQPNLAFNRNESEQRRQEADASVKPVYIQIKKNEMLVREGQRIGPQELLKLNAHGQGRHSRHGPLIFITIFLFAGLSIWVVVQVSHHHLPSYQMELRDLIFLGILLVLLLALGRFTSSLADMVGDGSVHLSGKTLIYAIPLTAGAMMVSIFFGVTVSLIFSLLLTVFAGMMFGRDFGLFFYFLLGSFVAAHGVTPCRNRMVPIKAGLLVGLANLILIVLNALLLDQGTVFKVMINAFFGFCGGVFSGILVIGLTPLAEMVFGYTTDIKLLELATMDQPLLQELMVQAPGTYHHSIIVGNMVEAAAKSIGANSLLAKVAAYYHDIGKIKKPLYFIENQFDCQNRHERLAPSMSSLILISHVKEGVERARQHRLGKALIDIISQHHGTSCISFFYKKAQEAREKAQCNKGAELPAIDADDFRYPGPKPQTKEAGLVMLADVVEAACRSLTEPTPARIQGMVNRLINNIFSDGQLEECELTLKDLHQIAKHFNQILATIHHKRIEYPMVTASEGKGKMDVADPSQRESKQDRDRPAAGKEGGKGDLKRLGLH